MLRPSGDAKIGKMLSRVLRYMSPEVSQTVATRMGAHQMAKAMASNNSVPATGIQNVGYRAGTPFGFQYRTMVPDRALEVGCSPCIRDRRPPCESPGESAICAHQS